MRSFRIGSLFGIPIKLDLTFLLVLPLFAYLIGTRIEPVSEILNEVLGAGIDVGAITGGPVPWLLGLTAAVGLFVGVILHELGHSLTARRYGFPIDSITLWLFGGIASFSEMPEDWRQELNIAIAGPIVSVLVGVGSYGLFVLTPELLSGASPELLGGTRFVLGYLAILNVALAVFNMLPAFPMDGGRVLRALLARGRPYAQATQQAASVGKLFAVFMGLFGLFALNIILIGVAFFVFIAASSEAQQVTMKAAFQDVTVGDIMTPVEDLHTVEPDTTVAVLIERMFRERHTGYPVVERSATGEGLVGLVTLSDAREVDQVEREAYTVADVMTTDLQTITPDSNAMTAIERMQEHGIGRLLVVEVPDAGGSFGEPRPEDGDLVGLISRSDVMTALDIVQQSGAVTPSSRPRTAD
ncbi:hypothetical protein HTG_07580 [Natrinema mahii]|nr:hypothetical protein HTG_07580 [Natrinema mahii]